MWHRYMTRNAMLLDHYGKIDEYIKELNSN